MTEEEAKTKWCPHMFPYIGGQNSSGHNFYADQYEMRGTDSTTCIGSKCMSWRWTSYRDDGYCGLAGKP